MLFQTGSHIPHLQKTIFELHSKQKNIRSRSKNIHFFAQNAYRGILENLCQLYGALCGMWAGSLFCIDTSVLLLKFSVLEVVMFNNVSFVVEDGKCESAD